MPILLGCVISSSLRVTISLFGGMSNGECLVWCIFNWGEGFGVCYNRLCCLWYSILMEALFWFSLFDVFCVIFWLLFSVGGILASGFHCVFVRSRCWACLLYIGSGYPIVLCGSWFRFVCAVLLLLCPLYNAVGVVLLSSCVCLLCSLWSFTGFCAM